MGGAGVELRRRPPFIQWPLPPPSPPSRSALPMPISPPPRPPVPSAVYKMELRWSRRAHCPLPTFIRGAKVAGRVSPELDELKNGLRLRSLGNTTTAACKGVDA